MDLSTLKPSEKMIEITHPSTGEDLGVRVTVMSLSDDRLKKLKRKFLDTRLQKEARGKHFKAEEVEDNRDTLAFAAILDWDWYGKEANFEGTKPAFSQANVLKVFNTIPWFRDQIEEAIGDDKTFFSN